MNGSSDELARFFHEVVLVIGGVFALHPVKDRAVRTLARGLERAYRRAELGRATTRQEAKARAITPHPAIARLLRLARPRRELP